MDEAIKSIINVGAIGGLLVVVIYFARQAAVNAWRWFTGTYLPEQAASRKAETEALVEKLGGEIKTIGVEFKAEIGRLIEHMDAAAKTQAENEGKIVGALESVKSAVSKGFADMKKRFEELEGRVRKLEEKN